MNMKVFYIVDSESVYKDLSRPYNSRSEAYNDLVAIEKYCKKGRFYIIERAYS